MSSKTHRLVLAIQVAGASVAISCSDPSNTVSPALQERFTKFSPMSSCGSSFRAISNETDSLMVAYGIGTTNDTVDVCESWTGSDYAYQVAEVGSSDNLPGFTDTVQTVAYQSGYVTGFTQSGASAADPSNVGATLFDLMRADNPTRQASYDDPYYGVSSHDPTTCLQAPCPIMLRSSETRVFGKIGSAASAAPDSLFKKHGLSRKGVRALVDDAEEIDRSANGYRRFRSVHGDEVTIRSIEPTTQLLMEEESTSPRESMHVVHKWSQVFGGYVHDRSDYVTTEKIDGKKVTSFGSIEFKNVKVSDPAYPPLAQATLSN